MGYRIESYTLNELSKISMPEVVVPSLFWVVPIGNWRYDELEDLWNLFTRRNGNCKDIGLVLIKGDLGAKTNVDLDLLRGANLYKLMPKGVDTQYNYRDKSLLFLSGGYPQPGWGVLVKDIPPSNPSFFIDELVKNIVYEMRCNRELRDIKAAAYAYHECIKFKYSKDCQDEFFYPDSRYKDAYIQASSIQWELGPKFLVILEQVCLKNNFKNTSIAWDQPRMIGWKLWASGVNFSLRDIHETASSIFGNQSIEMNMAGDGSTNVSGSCFTDYVHFLACQDMNKNSRVVTREFVSQLTRIADRRNLFEMFSNERFPASSEPEVILDRLITVLGWPNESYQLVPSLASCINSDGDTVLTGNEIRVILESYCRDFIDVLTSQRNYSGDELMEIIRRHRSDYRFSDPLWQKHVSKLSCGSAIICIEALCNKQYENKSGVITKLVSAINKLCGMANAHCHFSENSNPPEWIPSQVGYLVKEILELTHELISEMPWHFTETQSNGVHPKVLTGNAWSHSHKSPRLTRLLLWRGTERVETNQLIWNPNRTNPVMTDPTIIKRPC